MIEGGGWLLAIRDVGMKRTKSCAGASAVAGILLLLPAAAAPQRRDFHPGQSVIRVHVFKTGFFSLFAHNHLIEAPIAQGAADFGNALAVRLRIETSQLRVLDPEAKESERAEIEKTMKGPTVLDIARFPEIQFESTAVVPRGDASWNVRGDLTLHGVTRSVELPVSLANGRYRGSMALRQRDFGIQPISIAGGTVKVKDEVRIDFDIGFAGP